MKIGMLPDVTFGASVRFSDSIEKIGVDPKHIALMDLREALADKIATVKTETVKRQFHTEYRLYVYVLTPDELMQLVHTEADKMFQMMMRADK